MRTIKTYSKLLLLFAILFCGACGKEEVTNPSVYEVKINGVITPVEHGEVVLKQFYRDRSHPVDTTSELVGLTFYTSIQEFTAHCNVYQYEPGSSLEAGVYPLPYFYNAYLPRTHIISAVTKSTTTPVPVVESRFEINNITKEGSRISLTFDYKIVRSPGDSVSVSGRLVNVPYRYTNSRW